MRTHETDWNVARRGGVAHGRGRGPGARCRTERGDVQGSRVPESRTEPDHRPHLGRRDRSEESQRLVRRRARRAACSKTENRGNTFTPIFDDVRLLLARRGRRSIRRTRTSSGSARARTTTSAASASATASTSPPTPARPGSAWGSRTPSTSRTSSIDPRNSNVVYVTAIGPLWRRAAIAASTRRPTAARPGRRC